MAASCTRRRGSTEPSDSSSSTSMNKSADVDDGDSKAASAAPAPARCRTCCNGLVSVVLAAIAVATVGALATHGGSPAAVWASVNFRMMRLFRDLSRVKARQRRFGQKDALMPVLMGKEEPLPLGDASTGLSLTLEELEEFDGRPLDGSNEHSNLYLAIHGRIYDVTAGAAFYGPGRSYHKLVGKDATRAFCTGCLEPACLIASTDGLSDVQLREAQRWIELYEHHDRYKLVGQVRQLSAAELSGGVTDEEQDDAYLAEVAAAEAEYQREQLEAAQYAERSKKHKTFRPK